MIASVSGMRRRHVVPRPKVDCTSTTPPMDSTLVRTTSIPTPRPDTFVTVSAVENPGRNRSCSRSWVLMSATWPCVRSPRSIDLATLVEGTQGQDSLNGLPHRLSHRWRLNAVIDRVADQVRERVLDGFEQPSVEFGVLADHFDAHLTTKRGRDVPHHPGNL